MGHLDPAVALHESSTKAAPNGSISERRCDYHGREAATVNRKNKLYEVLNGEQAEAAKQLAREDRAGKQLRRRDV